MSILQKKYQQEIIPKLKERYPFKNIMELPTLKKIIISMGIAEATKDKSLVQSHIEELSLLSGQKPIVTKARKSISNFKLREGQPIGLKVTLRKKRMYEFFYRFCNIVCPRIRDFRGFKRKGDRQGNLNIGIESQEIFPEINLDAIKRAQGMNITFITSSENEEECMDLLELLGFPFKES